MNHHTIMGRVGKDPEVRSFQDGGRVCSFSVATSETWKDRNTGEKKERTQWHNISIFNEPLVKVAETWVKKGKRVLVTGQVETRKWQAQDGTDRWSTETVLRPFNGSLQIIDWPEDGEGGGQSSGANTGTAGGGGGMDDEIPFAPEVR